MVRPGRALWHIGLLALTLVIGVARAGEVVAFSTAKARPIALGGAYFSAEDDVFAALWNPAGCGGPHYMPEAEFRAWFAPVTAVRAVHALRERDMNWTRDGRLTERELILGSLWGVKGVSIGWHTWLFSFVNSDEPLLETPYGISRWSAYRGVAGHEYAASLTFKLAPQVSLGAAATFDSRVLPGIGGDEVVRADGWGWSFGVLLRPRPSMNVGLAYVQRPDTLATLGDELERVASGSVNGGISWYPWRGGALLVDLRNLDDTGGGFGFAELHVGVEQTFLDLLSVRAGWYRTKEDGTAVYSGGVGLKAPWIVADNGRPGRAVDMLTYTFVYQNDIDWTRQWHMFALTLPLSL